MTIVTMLIASDYRLRQREVDLSISGKPDVVIVLEVLLYIVVAAWTLWTFFGARRLAKGTPSLIATWVFVGVLGASLAYSVYPVLGAVRVAQLAVTALVCQVASHYADRDQMERLLHVYVTVVAFSVVFGVAFPVDRKSGRFTWLYIHPVVSGLYLALAVVLLIGYLMSRRATRTPRRWSGRTYVVLLTTCVGGLLASHTRGALLGAAAGCLVLTPLQSLDREGGSMSSSSCRSSFSLLLLWLVPK